MLIVVQIGKTKRATLGETFRLFSALCIVTGKVAAEDLEKKARVKAGSMAFATLIGFRPRKRSIKGKMMSICTKLAVRTVAKYEPPTLTPALISDISCETKPKIPIGRNKIIQLMSLKSVACRPSKKFKTVDFPADSSGKCDKAKPKAAAIKRTARTLPERKGAMTLLGMAESRYSM